MANIVYANGILMCRRDSDDIVKDFFIDHGKINKLIIKFVDNSELAKVDGALTCCSVIF